MKVHNDIKTRAIVAGIGLALGLPGTAFGDIEEVIVTAKKREESANDVGGTFAVIQSAILLEQGISSMEDIAAATPGLDYTRSANNTPIYTLRGVGFNESTLGVYPSVSVYLDEAPLTFPVLATHAAFDLERLEVLKGPQGTLFGQNSSGGAINYIAAKPTDEFEAAVTGIYGRYNEMDLEGFVSGPLGNTLRGRIAVKAHQMDAWQRSVTRPGDKNGEEEFYSYRGLLDWEPSDRVRVGLNFNGWRDKSDPQAVQLAAVNSLAGEVVTIKPAVLGAPFPERENDSADWNPDNNHSDRELWQGVLRVEWGVADDFKVVSLSSYIDYDQKQGVDPDGVAGEVFELPIMDATAKTFSQELRLESSGNETVRWLVGANYEDSKVSEFQRLAFRDNSASNPGLFNIFQNIITSSGKMNNWAVFANLDWRATDRLSLNVGVRYTDSKIKQTSCPYDQGDGRVNELYRFLQTILYPGSPFPPITETGPGHCFPFNFEGQNNVVFNDTLSENNVSWRAGLDFHVNDDVLLYGSVSRGYKAGSYPTLTAASWTQFQPVKQESVMAYEVGTKARLLSGRMQVNAAAFYYDYKDKQIRGSVPDAVFGELEALTNIPKATILGAEASIVVMPTDGLTASLAATYLDHKIKDGGTNPVNIIGRRDNFDGAKIPFTADWSARVDVEYEWALERIRPFVGVTYSYQGKQSTALNGEKLVLEDAPANRIIPGSVHPFLADDYALLDLRAGVRALDDKWTVFIWGKNVTDEYYWINSTISDDTIARLTGKPATYGVTVNYKF